PGGCARPGIPAPLHPPRLDGAAGCRLDPGDVGLRLRVAGVGAGYATALATGTVVARTQGPQEQGGVLDQRWDDPGSRRPGDRPGCRRRVGRALPARRRPRWVPTGVTWDNIEVLLGGPARSASCQAADMSAGRRGMLQRSHHELLVGSDFV